ncbi:MAG TPA: hypothetical protein VM553_00330 [Dongiaceae bacterium]|nr:hypothetical protein [Dongiaceae bacterium]
MLYNLRFFKSCPKPNGIANARYVEIPRGTELYRFGHLMVGQNQNSSKFGHGGAQLAAYQSGWWFTKQTLNMILNEKIGNAQQNGRVMLAIHTAWAGDCFFLVKGVTKHDYAAWEGIGQAFDQYGNAVPRDSKAAAWIPPTTVSQLFIPGLDGMPDKNRVPRIDPGHPRLYWQEPLPVVVSASAHGGVTTAQLDPAQFKNSTARNTANAAAEPQWNRHGY